MKIITWDLSQQSNSYGKMYHPWWFGDYLWMRGVWVWRDGVGTGGFRWGLFGWSQMTLAWIVMALIGGGGYEYGQQVRVRGWKASSRCSYFNPQANLNLCVASYDAQMDARWRVGWWLSNENCECCIFLATFPIPCLPYFPSLVHFIVLLHPFA